MELMTFTMLCKISNLEKIKITPLIIIRDTMLKRAIAKEKDIGEKWHGAMMSKDNKRMPLIFQELNLASSYRQALENIKILEELKCK